jgi:uncharacterized membrane protein
MILQFKSRFSVLESVSILSLIIIGSALRLYHYDFLSFWYDELYSIVTVSNGFYHLIKEVSLDINPPLYYFMLFGWIKAFGNSPGSGRLLSVILSIVTIPTIYFLAKRVSNQFVAFSTTILLTFSSGALLYAQEVRTYSLLILVTSICFFLWLELIQRLESSFPKRLYLVFVLFSVLSIFAHNFGFFFANLLWVYLILLSAFKYKNCTKIFIGGFIIINLLYLPLILNLILNVSPTGAGTWVPTPNIEIYYHFYTYLFYTLSYKKIPIFYLLILAVLVPMFIERNVFLSRIKIYENLNLKLLPTLYAIFSLLLITYLFSQLRPIVTSRNLLVLMIPIYFLLSYYLGLSKFFTKVRSSFVIFLLAVLMSLSFTKYYYKNFKKEEWREATAYALEISQNNGYIFTYALPNYIDYYLVDVYHKLPSKQVGYSSDDLSDLLGKAKVDHISNIVFIESLWDTSDQEGYSKQVRNLEILNKVSSVVETKSFLGLTVYNFRLKSY